mgnify:CR=1 FL=1
MRQEFKPDTWCRAAYGDHDFSAPQTPLSKMRTYRYMASAPGSGNSEMRIYLTSVPGTVAGFQANWFLTNKPTIPPLDQPRRERTVCNRHGNRVPHASCFCRRRSSPADVRGVQKDFRDVPGLKPHTGIPPHIFLYNFSFFNVSQTILPRPPDVRFACGQGLWQLLIRDYASVFFFTQVFFSPFRESASATVHAGSHPTSDVTVGSCSRYPLAQRQRT